MNIVEYKNLTDDFYERKNFENFSSVNEIIEEVRMQGDDAVRKYSAQFGDGELTEFKVTKDEIEKAFDNLPEKTIFAIKFAIENVKTFAKAQLESVKEFEIENNGVKLGQKIVPVKVSGAYVPGGNYPLPSSAIMSCVPAKVAGVEKVIMCSPKIQDATIVAGVLAGVDEIYKVGGVQAIAAMAYGTQTISKVDLITGPGNKFVTCAKKHVFGECGIDFLAGPSEVLIIADETANADFIAADMLAQCEHDKDASAFLVTTSKQLSVDVEKSVAKLVETLATKEIAQKALENSYIITVDNLNDAVELSNQKAPEHLEVIVKESDKIIGKLTNYGSLFIGNYSAEVMGDYCSGTNHILPTNGVAKYSAGLSVFNFIKVVTYQESDKIKSREIFLNASKLADTEGLYAHKLAADLRLNNQNTD